MKTTRPLAAMAALLSAALLSGCAIDKTIGPNDPAAVAAENATKVITDTAVLSPRLRTEITPVTFNRMASQSPSGSFRATQSIGPTLTLTATVTAPIVDGVQLEATDVLTSSNYALITYGKRGEITKGAVDILDITTPTQPKLVAEIALSDADAQTALFSIAALTVYVGEGTSDPGFPNRGVVHVFPITVSPQGQVGLDVTKAKRYAVPSYLATGLAIIGNTLYVTSGTGGTGVGGLTAFDQTMTRLWTDTYADGRAVVGAMTTGDTEQEGKNGNDDSELANGSGRLCVVAGNVLKVYERGASTPSRSVTFTGNTVAQARSTVSYDPATDDCFVAAEDGGVVAISASSASILATGALPLNTSDAQANSATLWGGLLYVAGGSNGVVVMNPYVNGTKKTPSFAVVGSLVFPGQASANAISGSDVSNVILIADGLTGTRIVTSSSGKK